MSERKVKSKAEYLKEWRKQNKDYYKKYYSLNKEKWQKYYDNNKEQLLVKRQQYLEENKEELRLRRKSKLDDLYRKYQRDYVKEKRKNDINYRLRHNIRARLSVAMKTDQKSGSAIKDLGCSIEQFKIYLESKFQPGMNWDNYGIEWEIDHIKPLCSFDLSDIDQFREACSFINLQPLWKIDHSIKTIEDLKKRRGVN